MVTHVALHKLPSSLTDLRPQRTPAAAYANAAEASAAQNLDPIKPPRGPAGQLPPLDPKLLEKAVKDLSQGVQNMQRSLQFSIDESSGRTVIKVVDKTTQEVIRQIPEEHVLALAARLDKHAGILLKDEA